MAEKAPIPGSDDQAALSITRGPDSGSRIPLREETVVGRAAKSDLAIDDDSISASHARLTFTGGSWWLTDLGSANGTFVNGERVAPNERVHLDDGDVVRLGFMEATFSAGTPVGERAPRGQAAPRQRVAERSPGFRLPLWVLIVTVLVAIAAWLLVDVFTAPPTPEAPPAVEEPAPGIPAPETAPEGATAVP